MCLLFSSPGRPSSGQSEKGVAAAHGDREKIYALTQIADYYSFSGLDSKLSKDNMDQAIEIAELSRDRQLIARTWIQSGNRLLNWTLEDNLSEAMNCFQHAEKVARENDLDEELGYAYVGMARVVRAKGDYTKAMNFNNLALSIASASNNDSLKVTAYNSTGHTYRYRNEKLLAFRNYLDALNIAELSKKDDLLVMCYDAISDFYATIEEYDKAIDYDLKKMTIHRKNGDRYALLDDYNNTGKMFSVKGQTELSLSMFEKAIALADSLHYKSYKLNPYLGIANLYFGTGQTQKGMDYLNSHADVLTFFQHSGMSFSWMRGMVIYIRNCVSSTQLHIISGRRNRISRRGPTRSGEILFTVSWVTFTSRKGTIKRPFNIF